jgi:hypothetical protein
MSFVCPRFSKGIHPIALLPFQVEFVELPKALKCLSTGYHCGRRQLKRIDFTISIRDFMLFNSLQDVLK